MVMPAPTSRTARAMPAHIPVLLRGGGGAREGRRGRGATQGTAEGGAAIDTAAGGGWLVGAKGAGYSFMASSGAVRGALGRLVMGRSGDGLVGGRRALGAGPASAL